MPHLIYIPFVFALGCCIGSFLNVVVYRLPRGQSLVTPPSRCPNCEHRLAWYDNVPVFGWLWLRGKCRYCRAPISPRYPIVELVTGAMFVFYYIAYFVLQWRSCPPLPHATVDMFGQVIGTPTGWNLATAWPIFGLYLVLLSGLLAASLIDFELYIIPVSIPWVIAVAAFVTHALGDRPDVPGSLNLVGPNGPAFAALAAGGTVGLVISLLLWAKGILPTSFPQGEPLLEVDRAMIAAEIEEARLAGRPADDTPLPPPYTPGGIRREMRKEMLFMLPGMILAVVCVAGVIVSPAVARFFGALIGCDWMSGLWGSLLGALVGGAVVWWFRILGTLGFGRVAMGLGDVHLMWGVGAVIGGTGVTAAFFLAPFAGILIAIYKLVMRRGREMPLGPYLSVATAVVMLCYCPIEAYLSMGGQGLVQMVGGWLGLR